KNPGAKFLLAPPVYGNYGSASSFSGHKERRAEFGFPRLYVSAAASDEKLARILSIYDAVSFEPELYMLVNYGVLDEDYVWKGEPYNSYVERINGGQNAVGAFATGVRDGEAGKLVYKFPPFLFEFATSARAVGMIARPYKEMDYERDLEFKTDFDEKYPSFNNIGLNYYHAVLAGRVRVQDSWDDYVARLNANGLAEYNAYLGSLP
ncbi:MAG: hypothetical protein FWF03_03740, partial [Defluviitaleaceae bacterium]|nr:hypothetical protein [Defluviitaleaceae bacterium]